VISFEPTEEQELVRSTVREFAMDTLRGAAREADEEGALPGSTLEAAWALGLTASQVPEEHGGGGAPRSPLTNALVLEELAYGDAALGLAATAPSLFAMALVDYGTPEQQERHLPAFCGRQFRTGSLALVEPTPAFDPSRLTTVAEPTGASFRLSGRKSFVPLGDRADAFLVVARMAGVSASDGFAGQAAFIVPHGAPGLAIEREPTLGLRALPFARLDLDGVEVPATDRLGGERGCDTGRLVASARVALAAVQLGLSRAVLDYAIPYAKERVAFGEPIAKKQAIAFALADMAIEVDAMRWLVWKAAADLEYGRSALRSSHHARTYVAAQAMKIADDGLQVLGGHGFIREHPVELWYRHERTLGVLEGVAVV
jgi:alkylation response protein AidB-like acyl-CoA dehydrogenase